MVDPRQVPKADKPVMVAGNASAAEASRPEIELDARFHTYESNPVPWWLTVVWISFLVFGFVYLVVNLLE